MDERSDMGKSDEVLLPGFRFHPTDEELVGFYLKRKVQQKPLSIELIMQLDIYKYDPWDLPKLASSGEKEWYFYCPRDRKYRNSARPNRVTGAGFWKATGTDRPIYSSEGTKCIGLKKSLVFYKGRAAKGIKTDWMMHEFRLPSLTDPSLPKRPIDKNIPANDSWAICRIFKKTSSMAQRAMSHSWATPLPGTSEQDQFCLQSVQASHFALESSSCSPEVAAPATQFASKYGLQGQQQQKPNNPQDGSSFTVINFNCVPSAAHVSNKDVRNTSTILPFETQAPQNPSSDAATVPLNIAPGILNSMDKASPNTEIGQHEHFNGFADWPIYINEGTGNGNDESIKKQSGYSGNMLGTPRRVNFPFDLSADFSDEWKHDMPWESLPYPAEAPNNFSTDNYRT